MAMTVEELLAKIKNKDDKVRSAAWLAAGEVGAPGSQAAGRRGVRQRQRTRGRPCGKARHLEDRPQRRPPRR